MIYQNFDLEIISPQGGDRLCARVLESPQGDCPFIDVKWPFGADEENALLTEIYGGLRQRRGRGAQANSIQDFGGKLFEAVFSGDIEHLFRSSLDTAFNAGKGLRVRLRLPEDSELHMRPWEFLFDNESRQFLAVGEHTPLVRYLPVAKPIAPITVEGPLRVLVALSSPTDHPRLDIAREWEILCNALEPSISAGHLELRRVPGRCTFDNLRDSLRHFGAHIFHFVGHGIPGALVLEQESGKGLEMEATHLRAVFPSGALPRLIVLNACSGAITQDVPFSGLAQGFLRQGVPAVVAMQASITDDAALIFTRYFYRDLVEIGAVDASLTEARLRMQGNGHPIEWGTPVLYMRALNGQLFQPTHNEAAGLAERHISAAKASAVQERVEPTLNERKRTRELPKQEAPPLPPAANPPKRKKPRASRTRENTSQPKPGAHPQAQEAMPKVQAQESTLAPKPEPAAAEPGTPPTEYAAFKPEPAGPGVPPKVQAVEAAPRLSEPGPIDHEVPPKVRAEEGAPPPGAEPKPAEPGMPPDEARAAPPPPRPDTVEKIIASRPQVRLSPPPQPEPKPAEPGNASRVHAKKHTPPPMPRVEPILDEQDIPSTAQASAFVPGATPEPDQQGAPEQAPIRPPRSRGLLLYGAGACVLAAGLVVAIGVDRIVPPGESVPAPAPATAASSAAPARAAPADKPANTPDITPPTRPAATPTPPATNSESPAIASGTGDQAGPVAEMQTAAPESKPKAPETKPKKADSAARKAETTSRPAPSRAADDCKNEVVSERSANCLFENQEQ